MYQSCTKYALIFQDTIKSSVWTAGSYEGNACDIEKNFVWCSSGTQITESQLADARFWTTVPNGSPSKQRCLELKYDMAVGTVKLNSADCIQDKKAVICQVQIIKQPFL
jgi:hypothetical protein